MTYHSKDSGSKTLIWREQNGEIALIEEIAGLPYGTPSMGQKIITNKYGEVICSGITKKGSGNNEQVLEVKLTAR